MKTIASDKTDANFKYEIAALPGAEAIKKCFSCGTCTGACPVFRVEEGYNPRKILRMILLGMRQEVLASKTIWLCARCYACTAHCPQGISFADIMVVLQDLAVKEGHAAPGRRHTIDRISQAAAEFRKDCIQYADSLEPAARDQLLEKVRQAVEQIGAECTGARSQKAGARSHKTE